MAPTTQPKTVPGIKKILAVSSGKGGVGKTFVSVNLAVALSRANFKVGILDADIYCPDVFKMLGLNVKISPNSENKIIPVEKWGVKAMSMAPLCSSEDEPIAWRAPIITRIISQLLKETQWGELDFLIIDMPSGTGDIHSTLMQNFTIDGMILVTTPQNLSTVNVRRAANLAIQTRIPVIGLIENMRGEIFGEGGGVRTAEVLYTTFLGSLPMRKQITALCDQGTPPVTQMEEIEILFSKIVRFISQKYVIE